MKSKAYWKKRAENISDYEFQKVDNYKLKLEREYRQALKSIQYDVENFYRKFAKNNEISLIEAKKLLNSNELREFKIDLKEFIRKAKNNKSQRWEKELNNLSYKVRVTRLQALQTQIKNQIEDLCTEQQNNTTSLLSDVYKDTYYRNIFEVHKGLGIGVNFAKLDTNTVNKIITEPWQGSNYSSRIWNNKEILIKELQCNLIQSFICGDSIDKTSKIIANKMNVGIGRARTLVNTESAYITSKATFDSYSRSGVVKQYQILATLDLHTSKICREMDGKIFDLKDKSIGITAPPFHPNCRTTIVPYFSDAIDEERIARDNECKVYYVDGNMDYKQWYDKYVKGNPKEEIVEKKIQNKSSDKKQFERYKEILGNEVPKSFDKFQELKYNNVNEWRKLEQIYNDTKTGKVWLSAEFSNEKKFKKHIEKHLNEYGNFTEEEYLNTARELLASPVKDDIEGFKSELGFIFRYNKATNDFAIGRDDGYISTLYKPKDGCEHWLQQIRDYKKED